MSLAVFAIVVVCAAVADSAYFWISCGLGCCLLALALVDWSDHILPDWGTLGLLMSGLCYGALLSPFPILHHVLGALVGGSVLYCVQFSYYWFRRRDGLGWGDIKLLAAAGSWLGTAAIPTLLLEASVAALAVVYLGASIQRRSPDPAQRIAFGPYLCLAFWVTWLFGPLEFL